MLRVLAFGVAVFVLAGPVQAGFVTGLYNTGVDGSGSLAADKSADLHYDLVGSADNSITTPAPAYIADSTKFPFVTDGWLPNGPNSKWIDPVVNQSLGNPPGDYIFETKFQITGGTGGFVISGFWSLDNIGKDILINGHSTGIFYDAPGDYSFKAFQSFVLPSEFFVDGTNTLDFVVNNTDNGNGNMPVGFRAEFTVTNVVPEPASAILGAFGVAFMTIFSCFGGAACRSDSRSGHEPKPTVR